MDFNLSQVVAPKLQWSNVQFFVIFKNFSWQKGIVCQRQGHKRVFGTPMGEDQPPPNRYHLYGKYCQAIFFMYFLKKFSYLPKISIFSKDYELH